MIVRFFLCFPSHLLLRSAADYDVIKDGATMYIESLRKQSLTDGGI